jgi:anti-sigma B factor antagonist
MTVRGHSMLGVEVGETTAGVRVIVVKGEVDASTAPQLHDVVDDAIAQGAVEIVLDVSGVEFMSSAGLGVIAGLTKTLRERGGTLRLRSIGRGLQRILEVSGVLEFLDVDPS